MHRHHNNWLAALIAATLMGQFGCGDTPSPSDAGTSGAATTIALQAGNAQIAPAGSAVAVALAVIARDANSNPVSGVSVTFTVTGGSGTTNPASPAIVTTNAAGIAALTSWTLGTTAGANTLLATSAGLAGSPISFTATGVVGPTLAVAVLTLLPRVMPLRVGETMRLSARTAAASGSEVAAEVLYSSANGAVVAVDADGSLRGIGAGTTWVRGTVQAARDSARISVVPAGAGLSSVDSARVTAALERLAQSSDASARGVATPILQSSAYRPTDLHAFFAQYLTQREITDPLHEYLVVYTLGSGDLEAQRRVQIGLTSAMQGKLASVMAVNSTSLPSYFGNTEHWQGMYRIHWAFAFIGYVTTSDSLRNELYGFETEHLKRYAALFRMSADTRTITGFGDVRKWAYIALVAPFAELPAAVRNEVATTLQLGAESREILLSFGVLNADAARLTSAHSALIRSILSSIPPLHDLRVAVSDLLLPTRANPSFCCYALPYPWRVRSIIGIGGDVAVGIRSENVFPSDVPPGLTDLYGTLVVHELNHIVDANLYRDNFAYRIMRDRIIATAGRDSMNYLRSMIPTGYFANAPGELFSSVSQQWWANSESMIRLAKNRWDAGRRLPAHQLAWYVDTYSNGGNSVPMYVMTTTGQLAVSNAPVTRDGRGRVVSLSASTTMYSFPRDADGDVVSFTVTGSAGAATTIALNAGNAQTATVGSAVAVVPSVLVRDANGNPVAGVSVTFAVTGGTGTTNPASPAIVTTNGAGIAALTSWILGTNPGANSLSATSAGLAGSPVSFTATGVARTATQIAISAGNNQSATAGTPVTTPPAVVVRDANNNPVPGVAVTFALATGGGSITGAAQVTNASGSAAVGSWTLGATAGTNTLTVASTGLMGSPLTFTATGTTTGASGFASLTAGGNHTCGLTSVGSAFCWGFNLYGQLGDGSTIDRTTPVGVFGSLVFASLTAGGVHTCGLTSGGAAYCWGINDSGQLGDGSTTDRTRPVSVLGGRTFASLSAGSDHTCALTSGGAAYCWGRNYHGKLGDGSATDRTTPVAVSGGLVFASLSAGTTHSCGVTTGGSAYCWGYNEDGQLGDGSTTRRLAPAAVLGGVVFASLTAGGHHTCGVTSSGAAYCWGFNNYGQVGDGSTIRARTTPVAVSGGRVFASLTAGFYHSCAVTIGGAAYCWGFPSGLGAGASTEHTSPVAVSGGLTFGTLTTGRVHSCGLTSGKTAFCWGYNRYGQVGDGSTTDRSTPVVVRNP